MPRRDEIEHRHPDGLERAYAGIDRELTYFIARDRYRTDAGVARKAGAMRRRRFVRARAVEQRRRNGFGHNGNLRWILVGDDRRHEIGRHVGARGFYRLLNVVSIGFKAAAETEPHDDGRDTVLRVRVYAIELRQAVELVFDRHHHEPLDLAVPAPGYGAVTVTIGNEIGGRILRPIRKNASTPITTITTERSVTTIGLRSELRVSHISSMPTALRV